MMTDDHQQPRLEKRDPVEGPQPVQTRREHERPLGDLFDELVGETRMLIRQEVELAKAEAGEKASKAAKNAGFIVGGGLVAYAGALTVILAIALLLATLMPDWLAFLVVGAVVLIVGYAVAQKGISGLKRTDFSLERTVDTLKEDKQWLKEEVREVKEDPARLGARR